MQRVVRYDLLRIIACLGVVLLHVSGSYWYNAGGVSTLPS